MQKTFSRIIFSSLDWRSAGLRLIIALLFVSSLSAFTLLLKKQWKQENPTVYTGLYYTFEFNTLVDHVQTGKPFDFVGARGWRRGPAAYIWMWPFARYYGKVLSPKFIFFLQGLIVLACIYLSVLIFDFGGSRFLTISVYSCLWLGAASLKYRISLGDINSLFSFSLFPLFGFYALTLKKPTLSAFFISLASHFRVLTVAELFYLVLKHKRALWAILATTFVILFLGTLLVSPLQGYLYWITMARDLLFSGSGSRGAFTTWHENLSIRGVILKLFAGFYFGDRHDLRLSAQAIKYSMRVALLLQGYFFWRIIKIILENKKIFNSLPKSAPRALQKALLLNEFGVASLLTYILAPEYGNDFLITLMPAFLFGTFFYFQKVVSLEKKYWFFYVLATFLTLGIVPQALLCRIVPFGLLNFWIGNIAGFRCYESINVFLIPVIGIALNAMFLLKARKAILGEMRSNTSKW